MYNFERWVFEKKRLEEAIVRLNSEMEYRRIEIGDTNINLCRGDRPHSDSDPVYTGLALQKEDLERRHRYLTTFGVLLEDGIAEDRGDGE